MHDVADQMDVAGSSFPGCRMAHPGQARSGRWAKKGRSNPADPAGRQDDEQGHGKNSRRSSDQRCLADIHPETDCAQCLDIKPTGKRSGKKAGLRCDSGEARHREKTSDDNHDSAA